MSKPAGELTPTQIHTSQIREAGRDINLARIYIRRRLAKIGQLQKTRPDDDVIHERLLRELLNIQESAVAVVKANSQALVRPVAGAETIPDTDAIMEELTRGKKI